MNNKDSYVIYEIATNIGGKSLRNLAELKGLPLYELSDNYIAVLDIVHSDRSYPSLCFPVRVVGMITPCGILVIDGQVISKEKIFEYVDVWKRNANSSQDDSN